VNASPSVWAFAPGLFLIGLGVGGMMTPSVNLPGRRRAPASWGGRPFELTSRPRRFRG
jgi:hypothetical protein